MFKSLIKFFSKPKNVNNIINTKPTFKTIMPTDCTFEQWYTTKDAKNKICLEYTQWVNEFKVSYMKPLHNMPEDVSSVIL
jgi:hypothetical protein